MEPDTDALDAYSRAVTSVAAALLPCVASLAVRTHAPLESYVGDTRTLAGATGSEVGDLFNMDVSL